MAPLLSPGFASVDGGCWRSPPTAPAPVSGGQQTPARTPPRTVRRASAEAGAATRRRRAPVPERIEPTPGVSPIHARSLDSDTSGRPSVLGHLGSARGCAPGSGRPPSTPYTTSIPRHSYRCTCTGTIGRVVASAPTTDPVRGRGSSESTAPRVQQLRRPPFPTRPSASPHWHHTLGNADSEDIRPRGPWPVVHLPCPVEEEAPGGCHRRPGDRPGPVRVGLWRHERPLVSSPSAAEAGPSPARARMTPGCLT